MCLCVRSRFLMLASLLWLLHSKTHLNQSPENQLHQSMCRHGHIYKSIPWLLINSLVVFVRLLMSLVTPRLCSEPQTCCGCVYLYCSSTACGCEDDEADEGEVVFSQLLFLCSADGGSSEQTVSLSFTKVYFLVFKKKLFSADLIDMSKPLPSTSGLHLDWIKHCISITFKRSGSTTQTD